MYSAFLFIFSRYTSVRVSLSCETFLNHFLFQSYVRGTEKLKVQSKRFHEVKFTLVTSNI